MRSPAPWTRTELSTRITDRDGRHVATASTLQDASLIVAAPDLLTACEAVLAIKANQLGDLTLLAPMIAAAVRKAATAPRGRETV